MANPANLIAVVKEAHVILRPGNVFVRLERQDLVVKVVKTYLTYCAPKWPIYLFLCSEIFFSLCFVVI